MNYLSYRQCIGIDKIDRSYWISAGDTNPSTGKPYAINPNSNVWDDNYFAQNFGGASGSSSMPQAPSIDVNSLYQTAYNSPQIQSANSAITQSQQKIDMMNKSLADAESKINDNPYLSEGERMGRVGKLHQSAAQEIANEQKNLALLSGNLSGYKTDAENQINLALKNYDIQDKQYQEGVNQFNNLLSSGALTYASSTDIANLARQTGMSTSMIQSAVKAAKDKNTPQPQIMQFNDGTNQGYAVINPQTGEIISKQIVAGSAPTKYNSTGGGSTGGGTTKLTAAQEKQQNQKNLDQSIKNGVTLKSLVNAYGGALGIDYIYQRYAGLSPFGKPKETLAQVKSGTYADDPKKKK